MFEISLHTREEWRIHDYRPATIDEAHAVAQELSRDFSGIEVCIHDFASAVIATYRNGVRT